MLRLRFLIAFSVLCVSLVKRFDKTIALGKTARELITKWRHNVEISSPQITTYYPKLHVKRPGQVALNNTITIPLLKAKCNNFKAVF